MKVVGKTAMKHQGGPFDAARLQQVDSLRAIAIFCVVIYHYAIFWTPSGNGDALLPYGDALAWIPLAAEGYQGVLLFFIVSGFVISLSLKRASTLVEFGILRAIRLWPTLIVGGSLTFLATSLFGPDELHRSVLEYLISLTFVPPGHVGKVIGIAGLEWLDGAYWTLWTEVRFYLLAGLMYFLSGGRFMICWAVFFAGSTAVGMLAIGGLPHMDPLARLIFAAYQPYFTIGIALAAIRQGEETRLARLLYLAGIATALAYASLAPGFQFRMPGAEFLVASMLVFFLGTVGTLSRRRLPVLSWGWMVVVGQASYWYYLLHQNFGLAMLRAFNVQSVGVTILIQAGVLVLSVALTNYLETPIRQVLRRKLRRRPVAA